MHHLSILKNTYIQCSIIGEQKYKNCNATSLLSKNTEKSNKNEPLLTMTNNKFYWYKKKGLLLASSHKS